MMKRREFCRQFAMVGGTIVLAPLIKSCTPDVEPTPLSEDRLPTSVAQPTATMTPSQTWPPQPTSAATAESTRSTHKPDKSIPTDDPQQSPSVEGPVATIGLVKTGDRAYGVRRAIRLLNLNPVRGNRVLLKPNYNSADPAPASTHRDVMRSLVTELNEMGANTITVGERSGMGDTHAVLSQMGVFNLADELGFDAVIFDELEEDRWVIRQSVDFHWKSGFAVPKILLDSECVVQVCNLKTHAYGGHFTLSLKNSVGLVARSVNAGGYNYMSELHNSPYQRQMIAEINAVYSPSLIVMDGVDAFVNGGPATGKKVSPSIVIAGSDQVAIDAVGVAILRLFGTTQKVSQGRVFEQEQIARAVELGLGIDSPDRIRIVTGDPESEAFARQISQYLS